VRIGLIPLTLAVLVAATRLTGAIGAADLLAYGYLAVITTKLTRHANGFVPTRPQGQQPVA
jgi:hypothetical protein